MKSFYGFEAHLLHQNILHTVLSQTNFYKSTE